MILISKEQIYATPVLEAFRKSSECPFCHMRQVVEGDAISYMLGPAYMDDRIRMATNEIGFCSRHYIQMYDKQNRLGLGLMLDTHMQKVTDTIEALANRKPTAKKIGFSLLPVQRKGDIAESIAEYIKKQTSSCYVCDKINSDFERYVDTFFYLWKQQSELIELVKGCNGFCLEHFGCLLENRRKLGANEQTEFLNIIIPLQIEHLKRVSGDVSWFVKKFDYQYAHEPWKNSKDSLPRAILKMSSN